MLPFTGEGLSSLDFRFSGLGTRNAVVGVGEVDGVLVETSPLKLELFVEVVLVTFDVFLEARPLPPLRSLLWT